MKKIVQCIGLLIGGQAVLYGQAEQVWAFGAGLGLDFNRGTPTLVHTAMDTREACASVCDVQGQLLFYTNGSTVWNGQHRAMLNGENLALSGPDATKSTAHGTAIVPKPGGPGTYFVFSITQFEAGSGFGKLYCSTVDMLLDGGKGDVVAAEKGILLDTLLTEGLAVVQGDRCNIWLIAVDQSMQVRAYSIDESGIHPPVMSNVGILSSFYGGIEVAHSRKKIAFARSTTTGGYLCDFDAASGRLSKPVTLMHYAMAYDVAFSPDDSKLYFSTPDNGGGIVQYDISSEDAAQIRASQYTVCKGSSYTTLKQGPDKKIYFVSKMEPDTTGQYRGYLGIIERPDGKGAASAPNQNAIPIVAKGGFVGLPNSIPLVTRDSIYRQVVLPEKCFPVTDTVLLSAADTDGWDYTWNTGVRGYTLPVTAGTYWLSYKTAPCVVHVDTFQVQFPGGILPAIHTKAGCRGHSSGKAYASTYTGDTVGYRYTWRDAGGLTLSLSDTLASVPGGNYTLQVQTTLCDTLLYFTIPEEDHRISFRADSIICLGDTLVFQNTSDNHFSGFYWDFGDGHYDESVTAQHSFDKAGRYRVRLAGYGAVCLDTVLSTITVDPKVAAHFSARIDSLCVGEAVVFEQDVDTTTLSGLYWNTGDGISFATYDRQVGHAYDRAGIMEVLLQARFRACPESTFSRKVYVSDLPEVNLGRDSSICPGAGAVVLYNKVAHQDRGQYYLWSTGDTGASVRVVQPGQYSLKVIEAVSGCSHTASISIEKGCYMDIPNAFTPNGDGQNDFFFSKKLLSRDIARLQMQVFDRWGQLVFESPETEGRGWDGRCQGKALPQAVYIYHLYVLKKDGAEEHYSGNVTLIR